MSILTTPLPGSRKVYVKGLRDDVRVPMREIALSPSTGRGGEQENEPIRVYDASGPYTDPAYDADVRQGLPALRKNWIQERGDVEAYVGREYKAHGQWLHIRRTGSEAWN